MELCFEKKSTNIFAGRLHMVKSSAETVEAVVPDTNDDIARVASLQTMLLLKGKDISARGITVTGEARAWLLYITEGGAVQSVQLAREFSIEYESDAVLDEKLTHVALSVNAAETRVLNPRKVAVTFEICGELWAYSREELCVSANAGDTPCRVYAKQERCSATPVIAVTEKTFVLTEQFAFADSKPQPAALLSQNVEYELAEINVISGRAVVKGNVRLKLCYASDGADYPVTAEFSSPFSQLIDVPDTDTSGCAARVEINGAYLNIIDTINGTKAVDVELHCLTELVCFGREEVQYISDMYCNTAALTPRMGKLSIPSDCELRRVSLSFSESIEAPEDCADVLAAFTQICRCAVSGATLSAQCLADIIYRSESGGISVMKRTFSLEGDCPEGVSSVLNVRVADTKLYPAAGSISVALNVEAVCLCAGSREVDAVLSAELSDETETDCAAYPSVTLVRMEGESLWQLAKSYHSSEEAIIGLNGADCSENGALLLIPKTK